MKKCIRLSEEEFAEILQNIFDDEIEVETEDSVRVYGKKNHRISTEEITDKLKDYFGASAVTAVNPDSLDFFIWVAYEE